MKIKNKNRAFTLIELILVIIVIGILAAMALPKFIGVQRNANVAAMQRDLDVIEKAVILYFTEKEHGDNPFVNNDVVEVSENIKNALLPFNDDCSDVYEIDLSKLDGQISRLKYKDDVFLYSTKLHKAIYEEGKEDGDGKFHYILGNPVENTNTKIGNQHIKNVKISSPNNRVYQVNWEQTKKVTIVYVYYDDTKVGESTTSSFSFVPASNNIGKEIKLVPYEGDNELEYVEFDGLNFPYVLSAYDENDKLRLDYEKILFDYNSTKNIDLDYSNQTRIYWSVPLKNKELNFSCYVNRYNANNLVYKFIDENNNAISSGLLRNFNNDYSINRIKIPIPEKSIGIIISNEKPARVARNDISNIEIKDIMNTPYIDNLNLTYELTNLKLTWDKDDSYDKVQIIYDNALVKEIESSVTEFIYCVPTNNKGKNIQVIPIKDNTNYGHSETIKLKETEYNFILKNKDKDILLDSGNLFDGSISTGVSIGFNSKDTYTLTWNKELPTNKKVKIDYQVSGSIGIYLEFLDIGGNVINSQIQLPKSQKEIVYDVPSNAVGLKLSPTSPSTSSSKVYEITFID